MNETEGTVPEKKKSTGAPKGNTNRATHRLYYYQNLLSGGSIDKRSLLYRELEASKREYATALGGDVSPQEKHLITDTVETQLIRSSVSRYLFTLKSPIRKGRVHPVMDTWLRLGAHIRENLKALGLKRVAKQLTLDEMLAADDDNGTQDNAAGRADEPADR